MTVIGILVVDVLALLAVVWVLDLVRRGRLYVGYGVVLVVGLVFMTFCLSISRLAALVTRAFQLLAPAAGPILVAVSVLGLLIVYILTQLSIVADRLATLVQEIAIQGARTAGSKDESSGQTTDRVAPAGTETT